MHGLRWVIGEKNMEYAIYSMYVDTSRKSPYMGVASYKYYWDAKDFNKLAQLEYDGRILPVPNHYDKVLKLTYGDYMQLPPENKRLRPGFEDWICKIDTSDR